MRNLRLGQFRGKYAAIWLDDSGKTRRNSLGTTDIDEARTKFAEFKYRVHSANRSKEPTLGEIMDEYITDRESAGKDAPRIRYSKLAMADLMPLLPQHVTREEVRAHISRRKEQGKSGSTIHTELGYLRSALKWAENDKWIERAPYIVMPQKSRPRDRWLTRDEVNSLIDAARTVHMRLFIVIALNTAARTEAILDLEWDRVDFDSGIIDFNPRLRPITKKRRAIVPMNNTLRSALEVGRKQAMTQFVVEYAGRRLQSIKKGFGNAVKRAGLEGSVSPHTLRHTAATYMAQSGVRMSDIAAFLGHDDSRTTERVYAKWSPDYLKEAAGALDDY